MLEPEITDERGERVWLWIISQVGEESGRQALGELGNRRLFPLNVARHLRLVPPAEADLPSTDAMKQRGLDARARLRDLVAQMKQQQRGS